MRSLISIAVLVLLPHPANGQGKRWGFDPVEVTARYRGRIQGDSAEFTELDAQGENGERFTVFLDGVDAPESDQPLGDKAQARLYALLSDERTRDAACTVRITFATDDRRTLAYVYRDDVCINEQLIADGLAWHDVRFNRDPTLAAAQLEAMRRKRGIWRDPNSVPPWVWRNESERGRTNPFEDAAPVEKPTAIPGTHDDQGFHLRDLAFRPDNSLIGEVHNMTGKDIAAGVFSIAIYGAGGTLKDAFEIRINAGLENGERHAFRFPTEDGLPKGGKVIFQVREVSEF